MIGYLAKKKLQELTDRYNATLGEQYGVKFNNPLGEQIGVRYRVVYR